MNTYSRCIVCKGKHRLWERRVTMKRLQPRVLSCWQIKNFAFRVYGTSTHSASALNQESAEQKCVIVRITHYCMKADGVLPAKQTTNPNTIQSSGNTAQSKATKSQQPSNKTSTMPSVTDVKGLLQVTALQWSIRLV